MDESTPEPTVVTRSDLREGLAAAGVVAGEVVMVHSSLSAFGHVEGGADAAIDALLEAVAPGGTVVVPTFTWGAFHDRAAVEFDMAETPCETGRIAETFRKRPNALRSGHVCHSVAAIGPEAGRMMGEAVSPFGSGSTFDALYRLDGRVVLLGVGFESCTALHAAEEIAQVPYRRYRDFRGSTVIHPDGRRTESRAVEYLRTDGVRNDFAKMGAFFRDRGCLGTARVGEGLITTIRMRQIIDRAVPVLREDPWFLTVPGVGERA